MRDRDKALGYLRTSVLNGCRTAHRNRTRRDRALLLAPDGGTVVCATANDLPFSSLPTPAAGCGGKYGPMFVAYSAATGERLRVLYQYTGACDDGVDTVVWPDNSARHVIGEQLVSQRNPPQHFDRYGVAAAGKFTKFQVAQHGQWYSGPAF
jgi:hypothetical protein